MKIKQKSWAQYSAVKAATANTYLAVAYMASTLIYDAWKLITVHDLAHRWEVGTILIVASSLLWYAASYKNSSDRHSKKILVSILFLDILFASYEVYTYRGMASRAIILFILPIIISGFLRTKRAIFTTATIVTAVYWLVGIEYFANHPSEGYKAELYGTLFFYGAIFYIAAALIAAITRQNKKT